MESGRSSMAWLLISITLFFHLVAPLAWALSVALRRPKSVLEAWTRWVLLGSYVALIVSAGSGWTMIGMTLRWPIVLITAFALVRGAFRLREAPRWPSGAGRWCATLAKAALSVLMLAGVTVALG